MRSLFRKRSTQPQAPQSTLPSAWQFKLAFEGQKLHLVGKIFLKERPYPEFKAQKYFLLEEPVLNPRLACDLNVCSCRVEPFIWISHDKRAIWMENPKVATRSIVDSLDMKPLHLVEIFLGRYQHNSGSFSLIICDDQAEMEMDQALKIFNAMDQYHTYPNSTNQQGFTRFFGSIEDLGKYDYFRFGFIRDPYERFFSNYRMFTQKKSRRHRLDILFGMDTEGISLEDFFEKSIIHPNHHWDLQVNFLGPDLDFLGKFEDMTQDWEKLMQRLDIHADLGMLNTTEQKSSLTFRSLEIQKQFEERYRQDFDTYESL